MASPSLAIPFGAPMRRVHFSFSPDYTPLNHGSYGATPVLVQAAQAALRAEAESAPDPFIALNLAARLRASRALVAATLRCSSDDAVALVANATTATDTVLRSLPWQAGDVVLCYEVVYGAVERGLAWVREHHTGPAAVEVRTVRIAWPASDDAVVEAYVRAAREENARPGRRVRLAVVDTVASLPGVRVPFERLVPALQAEGALVLVDGAHGIGHVELDLAALRPDFFVTNLHKWLFVPRGCAALVVPQRNLHLVPTSLPTSFGYRDPAQREQDGDGEARERWQEMFEFVGTTDMSNYLCVRAAIDFRNNVCGGEETIRAYCRSVAQRGAALAAEILGTEIMDCAGSCLRQCNFANVRLPLELATTTNTTNTTTTTATTGEQQLLDPKHAGKVTPWLKVTGVRESGMYFQTVLYRGAWWWRLSGMVYVEADDFGRGAEVLRALCERVRRGEHVDWTPEDYVAVLADGE
ncbi:putative aminotransferase family protein [Biscogniauxia sp. FL1348]|nr:putative aminotransferase family protein [Biscogniauxia sp. FL1348]